MPVLFCREGLTSTKLLVIKCWYFNFTFESVIRRLLKKTKKCQTKLVPTTQSAGYVSHSLQLLQKCCVNNDHILVKTYMCTLHQVPTKMIKVVAQSKAVDSKESKGERGYLLKMRGMAWGHFTDLGQGWGVAHKVVYRAASSTGKHLGFPQAWNTLFDFCWVNQKNTLSTTGLLCSDTFMAITSCVVWTPFTYVGATYEAFLYFWHFLFKFFFLITFAPITRNVNICNRNRTWQVLFTSGVYVPFPHL